ncbi:MAG: hypothetical protein AB1705_21750 [Verrucomicrobiota bacterium]
MKPVIRYRSQLLFRKSYKPVRLTLPRPRVKVFKPQGAEPRLDFAPRET